MTEESKRKKYVLLGIILILSVLCIVLTILVVQKRTSCSNCKNESTSNSILPNKEKDETYTVNSHYNNIYKPNDDSSSYLTFQVDYPSKYSVFSDDMITSYTTQGGSANPKLTFTLKKDPLAKDRDENAIFVYSGEVKGDINEWNEYVREENYKIISEKNIKKKNFNIYKRVLSYEDKEFPVYEAHISLLNKYSYYFHTAGNIPEKDFDFIVESIRIRFFDLEDLWEEG